MSEQRAARPDTERAASQKGSGSAPPLTLGRIESFRPPSNWCKSNNSGFDSAISIDFSPKESQAILSIYQRRALVSASTAERFKDLLEDPCHSLSPDELGSIRQVLGNMSDQNAFELRHASSSAIGPQKVLLIEGEWKASRKQFHGLLFPDAEEPRQIQEVFFEAPPLEFLKHIHEADKAIRTLKLAN